MARDGVAGSVDVSVGLQWRSARGDAVRSRGARQMARTDRAPERGLAVGRGARPADPGRVVGTPSRRGWTRRCRAPPTVRCCAGRIPDPFYGMNEQAAVGGRQDLVWRLRFRADADPGPP